MNFLNFEIAEFTVSSYTNTMAKKNNSLLGVVFKGAVDITAGILKHSYDFAEEVVKTSYDAATSKAAKKVYKKTGDAALDLMRFTPPKEKLDKMKEKKGIDSSLVYYLLDEEEHISVTYNSILKQHLNTDYNEKEYLKFKTHWRAICTQMVFGGLAKSSTHDYFEVRENLEKELEKKDSKILDLVNKYYSGAYATGGLETSRILNSHCFKGKLSEEAVDEFDRGFALIHKMIVGKLQ